MNFEIRKLYRRFANKEISAAELKSRTATLTALRSGMPDAIERPARAGSPMIVNVRSVAEG